MAQFKKYLKQLLIANSLIALFNPTHAAIIPDCDSASNQALVRSGIATINANNEITLTPDNPDQAGAAWSAQTISLANPFTLQFKVNLGNKDYDGADGLAFALHRDPAGKNAIGKNGAALGVGGLTPAVAIEFDTYYGAGDYNDITNDHTMIYDPKDYTDLVGGGTASKISDVIDLNNIEDGNWHLVEVNWNPLNKELNYKFDGSLKTTINRDLVNTDFAGNPEVYYGFAASTGGYYNQQSACIITVPPSTGVINHAPTITSNGGDSTATINLPEKSLAVTTVTATDIDTEDNVHYDISGGVDAAKFNIHTQTGALSFITSPTYNRNGTNTYQVQVRALDNNGASDTQDIAINITAVNVAPIITSHNGATTADINTPENQKLVTTITATDANEDTLTYSITGGADAKLFTIDANTGALSFITAPNYEQPNSTNANNTYIVETTVSDGQAITTQALNITVTNIVEPPILRVKALLHGAYSAKEGLMADDLRIAQLLPTTQPYSVEPFLYQGSETLNNDLLITTGSQAIVDWILVELRDATQPSTIVAQKAVLITREGKIIDANSGSEDLVFTTITAGNYYVTVRHRNHLAIRSAKTLALSETPTLIDFTLPSTATKSLNDRLVSENLAVMWTGDINQDNLTIATGPNNDATALLGAILMAPNNELYNTNYSAKGYFKEDINLDGVVAFAGPQNDTTTLIAGIVLHPENTTASTNFIMKGSLK